jgi:hypothetical protein
LEEQGSAEIAVQSQELPPPVFKFTCTIRKGNVVATNNRFWKEYAKKFALQQALSPKSWRLASFLLQNQNMIVVARAIDERKTFGHRSWRAPVAPPHRTAGRPWKPVAICMSFRL